MPTLVLGVSMIRCLRRLTEKLSFDLGWVSWISPDEWGMSFTYKEKYHGEPWALSWMMGTWKGHIHCRQSETRSQLPALKSASR